MVKVYEFEWETTIPYQKGFTAQELSSVLKCDIKDLEDVLFNIEDEDLLAEVLANYETTENRKSHIDERSVLHQRGYHKNGRP